jgi:hypothetical protein
VLRLSRSQTVILATTTCAVVLGGASLGSSTAATPIATPRCQGSDHIKTHTVAADSLGRVYTVPRLALPYALSFQQPRRAFGCLYSKGGSWPLNLQGRFHRLLFGTLALRSPWVAYADVGQHLRSTIFVRDLRDGAWAKSHAAVPDLARHERSLVTDIALKKNGNVAWIGEKGLPQGPKGKKTNVRVEVAAMDSTGFHVLDSGDRRSIDRYSLELHGSTLSWSDSGVTQSTVIR